MVNNGDKPVRLLSTWKQIAEYLGVTVRTAQMWERDRGLPVRRLPGSKSRVTADPDELDRWRLSPEREAADLAVPEIPVRRRPWLIPAVGLGAVCLALAVWWLWPAKPPAKWEVRDSALIVKDREGRELWRYDTAENLGDYSKNSPLPSRLGWIGDLDGDGRIEVLFSVAKRIPVMKSDEVLCFTDRGRLKWRFVTGESASRFEGKLRPPYAVMGLLALDTGPVRGVVISSVHHQLYPAQIALVSPAGALVSEYWHSGHLRELAKFETRSGPLILAGGISNGYGAATLVALDPRRMGGVSKEENERYQLPGDRAREEARILFPRSCINEAKRPYNDLVQVTPYPWGVDLAVSEDSADPDVIVFHHLDRNLSHIRTLLSSYFVGRHRLLETTGVLKHALNADEETAALARMRVLSRGPMMEASR